MERNRTMPGQGCSVSADDECPLLCLTKSIIFVVVASFILYVPLGDPHSMECSDRRMGNGAVCCLCDIYRLMVKAAVRVIDIVQFIMYALLDALYETKLKVYGMLGCIDKKDLCRSVCCKEEWNKDIPYCNRK